jgi:hypothetical protein
MTDLLAVSKQPDDGGLMSAFMELDKRQILLTQHYATFNLVRDNKFFVSPEKKRARKGQEEEVLRRLMSGRFM